MAGTRQVSSWAGITLVAYPLMWSRPCSPVLRLQRFERPAFFSDFLLPSVSYGDVSNSVMDVGHGLVWSVQRERIVTVHVV